MRSYLWGAAYAQLHGIGFDAELLYVASVLHDIALVPEFDSHSVPFEVAGGHVARVFAAGAGWSSPRRDRLAQVIERHMRRSVDVTEDPEGHLLELATSLDISGHRPEDFPAALRAEVLASHPRHRARPPGPPGPPGPLAVRPPPGGRDREGTRETIRGYGPTGRPAAG